MNRTSCKSDQYEIEIKLIIPSPAMMEALVCELRPEISCKKQVNYYFETADCLLKRNRILCRVRVEDEQITLGVKYPDPDGKEWINSAHRLVEKEVLLSNSTWKDIKAGNISLADVDAEPVNALKKQFGFKRLIMQGESINLRRSFRCIVEDKTFIIQLDRTFFPDGSEDFELEAEINEDEVVLMETFLRNLFAKQNIPWKIQRLSKVARFFKAIEGMKSKL